MMQSRFFFGIWVLLAGILLAYGLGHGLVRHFAFAPGTNDDPVFLYIEPGSSVGAVARDAVSLGLVRESWHFKLVTRWRGFDRSLYAGEYLIEPQTSLYDTLTRIDAQDTHKRRLVVPEGATAAEVDATLQASFGLDMAGYTPPEEGTLLPETYFYERGDTANAVLERMRVAQAQILDELWNARAPDLPVNTAYEAIILASIVEKETGVAAERPLVAAVFTNRLKRGMRLQSDPTVIYGIVGGRDFDRLLTRRDLQTDTPYNSYRRGGLPPTPIANPGAASIAAVLNPAYVPYLYFVADGTGGHVFAETLEEHNRNVANWRRLQKGTQ